MARKRKDLVYSDGGIGPYERPKDAHVLAEVKGIADKVRELQESIEAENSMATEQLAHFIDLYRGQVDLGVPMSKRFVDFDARSGKAPDVIHRAMGMLMAPLKAYYISPNRSLTSDDKAEHIQRHVMAVYDWLKRKQGLPFDLQALFWQLLGGKGYIQQTFLPNYWDKQVRGRKPEEKHGDDDDDAMKYEKDVMYNVRVDGYKGYMGPPFMVESLDPRTVWPIMTPSGPRAWVKKYKVQRYEAERAFERAGHPVRFVIDKDLGAIKDIITLTPGAEIPDETPTTNSHEVTYYEYIDKRWCFYIVEDKIIYSYEHKGGIKIAPFYGLVTGFKDFEMMAVSILYAVRNELPQYDFLRTLWANRAYIDVFPQLFAELGPGEEPLRNEGDGNPTQWEIEPMTIKQVRGKITNAFKDAQAGVDYRALVEEMAADIDLATISGLARGVGGAQQPGYAINQLSQAMRTIWKPLIESRQLGWSMLFEHYLWCLKHIVKEEVTVFAEVPNERGFKSGEYLSIEPDDVQDFFQILAELEPDLPIDAQGNMMTWMKAGADGWATDEEVSRHGFNKPDWKSRRRQIDRDIMRRLMRPAAVEAALTLGNIKLQQQVASDAGMDQLNAPFSQSLQSMRQSAGGTPTGNAPGANEQPPPQGSIDPAAAQQANRNGPGIQPTTGANPNNATPAARR